MQRGRGFKPMLGLVVLLKHGFSGRHPCIELHLRTPEWAQQATFKSVSPGLLDIWSISRLQQDFALHVRSVRLDTQNIHHCVVNVVDCFVMFCSYVNGAAIWRVAAALARV